MKFFMADSSNQCIKKVDNWERLRLENVILSYSVAQCNKVFNPFYLIFYEGKNRVDIY